MGKGDVLRDGEANLLFLKTQGGEDFLILSTSK